MSTLGGRIRAARELAGLTQSDVSQELEVRQATVSNWETDAEVPKGRPLLRMPDLFGVDGHWLLTGEGESARREPGEAEWRLQRVRAALEAPMPALPPPEGDDVMDVVKSREEGARGRTRRGGKAE